MSYDNFSVEEITSAFEELQAKRAGGFSAEESKAKNLAVSYDSGSGSSSGSGSGGTYNYGSYNDGTTVYVYGETDAYVDLSDTSLYGSAINIDATYSSGTNILAGDWNANIIWSGSYYNYLLGGYGNDILVGGNGTDVFIYSLYEGNDNIINASAADTVYLYEINLSDIVATASDGYTVALGFSTGEILSVTGTSAYSADFVLADGSTYWYSCNTNTWYQSE